MMEMEMNAEMDQDDGSESETCKSTAGSSAGTIFCNLERDFAKLLHEMKDNEALASYKAEYTRLFETLYNCQREEEQLLGKLRQLQEDTIDKTSRIYELEQTTVCQEETINTLREEIVTASLLGDAAHTREQNAQEIIENLRQTIVKLNHEIQQRNRKISMDENGSVIKQNVDSLKERERLINETETLRQRVKSMSLYTEELEKKIHECNEQMIKNQEQMDMQINDLSKERAIRDKNEKELQEVETELEIKNSQLQVANASLNATLNNANKLENSVREQTNANEKLRKEVSKLMVKGMNLETELTQGDKQIKKLEEMFRDKNNEYKILSIENKRLKNEIVKWQTDYNFMMSKCSTIENARAHVENKLKHTDHVLNNVETELASCQRQMAAQKEITDCAIRDKNTVSKTVDSLKDTIKKTQQMMNISEYTKGKIESELETMVAANKVLDKRLQTIEKEKDKYIEQINSLMQQAETHASEIMDKNKEILEYKKEVTSLKSKFQQQQNLFESIRSERNMYVKNLTGAQDEIQNLRDKLKLLNGQIEQVKEDAAAKQSAIVKGQFCLKKAEEEKEAIKLELKTMQKDTINLREIIEESKKMKKQFRDTMKTTNTNVAHLKKGINHVMSDRNVLGTQLVRRNDELSLQNSKIKILHGMLSRGESEYAKRVEDIRLLKLEINKLVTEKTLLNKSLKNMNDLRHETYHLNRDFTREQLKVTALEVELQNPINIHRWRKLQASDQSSDELLKKVNLLQKRIIKMNQGLILKSMKIKETEKLYADLREIVLKQPGPEFISILNRTKNALKERDKIIKGLIGELNMRECETNENSSTFTKVNAELRDIQMKYYSLKRNSQKTSSQEIMGGTLPAVPSNNKKYCGGGFTMLVAPSRNCWSVESVSK